MQVPSRDIEVRKNFAQTAVVRFPPEGTVHVGGIGAFKEVGKVARVIAKLAQEGDVCGEVVADEHDFSFVGGVGGGAWGVRAGEGGLETVGHGFGGAGDLDPFTCPVLC